MKKTPFSLPLHEYATTQIPLLEKTLGKNPENDTAIKARITDMKFIRDKFSGEHHKTKDPDVIGLGSIVAYNFHGKEWKVVIDNTVLCINGKAISIISTTPLGRALIGKKAGETAHYTVGGEPRSVEIKTVNAYDAKTLFALVEELNATEATTSVKAKTEKGEEVLAS